MNLKCLVDIIQTCCSIVMVSFQGRLASCDLRLAHQSSVLNADLVMLLQDYLVRWPNTLLVVSHARDFLNVVATDILHLHSRKLTVYKGNFDTFEKTAAERLKNARKHAESQKQQREHMQVMLVPAVEWSSFSIVGFICLAYQFWFMDSQKRHCFESP